MVNEIRERVRRYPGSLLQLADAAQVSRGWIYRFRDGAFPNPGIVTLERVSAALDALERAQPVKDEAKR